ncbi:MAG: CRTAC1 family protein [Chloroflexi bacterium]|nr:CRTAC1 family protein [Chloroflexota bacterium]
MRETILSSDKRFLAVMGVLILAMLLVAIVASQVSTAASSPSPSSTTTLSTRTSQPFAPTTPYLSKGLLFDNVTIPAGLIYQRRGKERLIGQAWGDVDGDGWLDLYTTDHAGANRLYQNNGHGRFSLHPWAADVSLPSAVSSGAVFADYDNDGRPDLLVLNIGQNNLFRNTGEGFEDVTETAGLAADLGHGKTASWGDYDNDGHLDLYIANWSCSPDCGRPTEGDRDTLYHNNGDGTFSDVTVALLGGRDVRGAGFVAAFVDYDNDGDLDIYLVNDEFINPIGNMLWRNDGAGCEGWCFTEVGEEAGANTRAMGMGLATADYDNDGHLDFYFSNAGPMFLLHNLGDGSFADVAGETGAQLGRDHIGWGAVFFDYDNDGWQDLYLAVSDYLGTDGQLPADILLQNDGEGGFQRILPPVSGLDKSGRTLGVAYADYDNDGWVDLAVGHFDGNYELYHNAGQANDNGRIAVQLIGGGSVNRDAIGARVTLELSDGRTLLQEVKAGSSLGAGDTLILHFGLGDAAVRQLHIRWPNGVEETHTNITSNQRYTFSYANN